MLLQYQHPIRSHRSEWAKISMSFCKIEIGPWSSQKANHERCIANLAQLTWHRLGGLVDAGIGLSVREACHRAAQAIYHDAPSGKFFDSHRAVRSSARVDKTSIPLLYQNRIFSCSCVLLGVYRRI